MKDTRSHNFTEAVLQMCSYKKMFWKYAAENTYAKVRFQ